MFGVELPVIGFQTAASGSETIAARFEGDELR
jgi:hypothetical protein